MDTDGAVRGEMLSRVFDAILDFIGDRAYAHNLIHAEASNHDGYNVPREDFTLFFRVVADTVEAACGSAWSTDIEPSLEAPPRRPRPIYRRLTCATLLAPPICEPPRASP